MPEMRSPPPLRVLGIHGFQGHLAAWTDAPTGQARFHLGYMPRNPGRRLDGPHDPPASHSHTICPSRLVHFGCSGWLPLGTVARCPTWTRIMTWTPILRG
jgi:hypothetical protein